MGHWELIEVEIVIMIVRAVNSMVQGVDYGTQPETEILSGGAKTKGTSANFQLMGTHSSCLARMAFLSSVSAYV